MYRRGRRGVGKKRPRREDRRDSRSSIRGEVKRGNTNDGRNVKLTVQRIQAEGYRKVRTLARIGACYSDCARRVAQAFEGVYFDRCLLDTLKLKTNK